MLLVSLALATLVAPQEKQEHVYHIEDVQLTIDLSSLKSIEEIDATGNEQISRAWTAKLGENSFRLTAWVYANRNWSIDMPEDLLRIAEKNLSRIAASRARTKTKADIWEFDHEHYIPGNYGFLPYTMIGEKLEAGENAHHYYCMAGIARTHSYTIQVETRKVLDAEAKTALLEFLRDNIRYDGEVGIKEWKDEEIEQRWKKNGPDGLEKKLEYYRTKHFVILTNSAGKKSFGKELEKSYKLIKKTFPFEERKELRLLPIFLFRTPQQYYEFCVKSIGWSESQARASKGVAYRDFYATWYEAPRDPVHIHEVTHQLFKNRLHISGGGSWFQEGVAEFMCSTENERKSFKRLAKKGRHVPLREFFTVRSLLGSNRERRKDGSSASHEAYTQAACIIEFVHEAKDYKGKFQEFIQTMGVVPRGDLKAIEGALREVYGVSLDQFEEAFLKYWSKR